MKAMILAAGMGTRLKPLTDEIPKALIPIGGIPMLEHVIIKLKTSGFTDIIINIHHFGEQIIEFLAAKDHFGIDIKISDERDSLLDTGGGIKHAGCYLNGDEPFLVHNVDIFSDVDLNTMYRVHINSKSLATLLVSRRQTSRQLLFDKENLLCGWQNRDTGEVKSCTQLFNPTIHFEYAFGGVHVISPDIFHQMEDWAGNFSIIDFYLSVCAKNHIGFYTENGIRLIDLGKQKGLEQAETWFS